MLNLSLGIETSFNGCSAILTRQDESGHALFGPYAETTPGFYEVAFTIVAGDDRDDRDAACARIDVAADFGQRIIASALVFRSQLADHVIRLPFRLDRPAILEFRVWVNGVTPLTIADETRLAKVEPGDETALPSPPLADSIHLLEALFESGVAAWFERDKLIIPRNQFTAAAAIGWQLDQAGRPPQNPLAWPYRASSESDLYRGVVGDSSSIRSKPVAIGLTSTPCRQVHFALDEFRFWMTAMDREPRLHRKEWEWFFVAQALFEQGMLSPGKRGLVFAVGTEPLPAVFAALGCVILATDQSAETALASGWVDSHEYSAQIGSLFREEICPAEQFFQLVSYRNVDMNEIPSDLAGQFDFCWSSCSCEHLGSIEKGLSFVQNSLKTLVPGGIAVHTTEYNLSSDVDTFESPGLSLFRRQDIQHLVALLEAAGHTVAPVDWRNGDGFAEKIIDLPPYAQNPHLRLAIEGFECTSIGLIIQKRSV